MVLSCILGIVIYITQVKVSKNNLFSFALTIASMFLMTDFIAARAQLVTFILFVLEILFVECFLEKKKKRYAVGLMLIACAIANLHAAVFYVFFVLLLPYFAEYIIVLLRDANIAYRFQISSLKKKIEKLKKSNKSPEKLEALNNKLATLEEKSERFKENLKKREENPYKIKLERRDAVKWLVIVAILCFAMGLLTPIGDEPYTHIFKLLSGNTTASISEHQPLVLAGNTAVITIFVMLFGILIFTDTKITLKDGFMIIGLIILTISARRQLSLLVAIGGLSFTKLICDLVNKYDKSGTEEFTRLMVNWKGKVLTLAVIVICSFCFYRGKIDADYINKTQYPVELADFIWQEVENGDLNLETMRIYNDYNYGSYLLYRNIPVFVDSRADLYSPEFNENCKIFDDYMALSNISTYYEDKFIDYGITHVVVYKNSKLNMLLERDINYKELYSDKYFEFYERLSVDGV